MGDLVPISIDRDPVCACGHGESLHRFGACIGCQAYSAVPWRETQCESFAEPGIIRIGRESRLKARSRAIGYRD